MISLMSSNLERWHARSLFLNKQLDNDLKVRKDLGRKKINSNIQPTNYFKAKISFKFCSLTFVWTNFNFKFSELYISSFPRVPSKFFKILDLLEPEKTLLISKNQTKTFFKTQDRFLLIFGFKKVGSQEILLRNCWHQFVSRRFFKARTKYAACKGSS